ncbi:ParA family protein [Haladaptatus sp. CMAA 1911]|uniref:ParA family protein n=1 Tax=unclassified Haladaptatus TaxID=2622732 RepID=UPI003754A62E
MKIETPAISFSNQKGGVGKTTTAINVAGALNAREYDVLFVDLDPQGNATEGLGMEDAYLAEPPTLYDVLTDSDQRDAITDIVREHDEMDVIPSNIDMTSVEPDLTLMRRGSEQLAPALAVIKDDYDAVIVDCPPHLGYLTDNALHAAPTLIVPALAEATSKRAVELLYDHINVLEEDFDMTINDLGILINRIDVRKNEATEMVEWFEQGFEELRIWQVRERAQIQRAFSAGHSIFAAEEACDQQDVFLQIADRIVKHFELNTIVHR